MAEKTLNKIKNTALNYASTALLRVELAAEESKLKKRFQALGQKLHGASGDAARIDIFHPPDPGPDI